MSSIATSIPQTTADPHLGLRWVRSAQALWLIVTVISIVVMFASLPVTYEHYMQPCDGGRAAGCLQPQINSVAMDNLKASGVRVEWVFGAFLLLIIAGRFLEIFLSGLAIWYGQQERYPVLWGFVVLTCSMGVSDYYTALGDSHPLIAIYQMGAWFNGLSLALAFVSFPDGRFTPRWSLYGAIVLIAAMQIPQLLTGTQNLPDSDLLMTIRLGAVLFMLAAVVYRYRHIFTSVQRQQAKWAVYTLVITSLCLWLWMLFAGTAPQSTNDIYPVATSFLQNITMSVTFIGFTIAILRYRLWDIDVIIQRTLVYGSLTGVVVGIYVLIVGTLSALFQTSGSLMISLVATGVVAVLFHPLRERLQRIVDRFVFGERHNPYAVISRLSERLESNVSPGTLLPGIAEMVAQALKLPYVAIALKEGDHFQTDAVYGQPADQGRITKIPLPYAQEIIGQMVIGQSTGDKPLDGAEHQLLENIARQTGIAAHAVQLSIALQQSRQHIITAREEERRRLRRDLHDGIGPTLAAQTIKVGAARALIENNPQIAAAILTELETSLATSMMDIRRLVYDLRPPALDQFGLAGAVEEFARQFSENGIAFHLDMPEKLPPLPAAVEVAAYRIVQEAVNNVIRHSHAENCQIFVGVNGALTLSIQDDGVGLPAEIKHGVGLNSIRERVEELGGSLTLTSHQGTQLNVRISL
jgi:signal transduction histidine kinase